MFIAFAMNPKLMESKIVPQVTFSIPLSVVFAVVVVVLFCV